MYRPYRLFALRPIAAALASASALVLATSQAALRRYRRVRPRTRSS